MFAKKFSDGCVVDFGYIYKHTLDSNKLKCELKTVSAANFAKQASKKLDRWYGKLN